ncbi:MAG: ribosome small subunit-dependent GTPase A [Treponema sp.]|nr:ribosome small subunit-dependent GTPase A [Treponema sp.]
MKALVLRGSRNLFTVRTGDGETECRIKGKVLKDAEGYYNPLAPGDIVEIEDGLIIGLEKRKNHFARFNQKGQAPQILAANADLALCMTTAASPPFRPRFLDRLLLETDYSGISAVIICNKYDLADEFDPDVEERLQDFKRIGFTVLRISAKTGLGVDELKNLISGKVCVICGQSGVGKSTLIKKLIPGIEIKTGALNEKYGRGNHTTIQTSLYGLPDGKTFIIDTPGFRRFAPERIEPRDLILYMREFAPLAGKCSYGLSCCHITEPGCKIMEAVQAGVIHEDRYESFLRIRDEMAGTETYPDND